MKTPPTSSLFVPVPGPSFHRTDTPTPPSPAVLRDRVDFSDGVDHPIEALVMPMADQVAAMIASNQFGGNAYVQVAVGDQRISYTLSPPSGSEYSVPGEINGLPFELVGDINPSTAEVTLTGRAAGTDFSAMLVAGLGEFATAGQVGSVGFEQHTSLDVWNARVDIEGKIAGESYSMQIGSDGEGKTVGKGSLGNRPISLQIEQGPNGSILVHQEIGSVRVEELISPN